MKIRRRPLTDTLLPTALTLLLAGCATGSGFQNAARPQPPEAPAADNIEEFDSVTAARENAVHHAEELALLEESLDAASQEEPPAAPHEQENDFPQLGGAADDDALEQAVLDSIVETSAKDDSGAAADDIWQRLRHGFGLPDRDHVGVTAHRDWYAKHQRYLDRTFDRAEPYLHHIVEQVEARGMPLELALLPVVESAFQPFAYSHGRAAGLWQFIPGTARRY